MAGEALGEFRGDSVDVGRVRDDEEVVPVAAVDDEVVDHPPPGVQSIVYLARPICEALHSGDDGGVEPGRGIGATNRDLAHVGDVEEPRRSAHREVLGHVPRVAHRHVPAGEVDQGGAERDVLVVKRGASHAASVTARSGTGCAPPAACPHRRRPSLERQSSKSSSGGHEHTRCLSP